MAVTWPGSCRTGTAGSPAAWLQTTSEPLARLVWLLHLSSSLGVCEQNMMCLILADMQYLCCISRVLLVLNWYPGSCQRPVKAILTPAYPTTTAYRKRKRNRASNDWSLLHYHLPASGSRWAASLQGEETKQGDSILPLHLHMCMREREHLWGAQCGPIFLFPVCLNPPTFTFHVWWGYLWSRITTRLSFCHLRVVRLLENRTSKPTEH